MKVYICDLTHDYNGVSNETMPLGAAFIKSYLVDNIDKDLKCDIFRYPGEVMERIECDPPNVLMVSNYVWNEALSLFVLKYAKNKCKETLTVMGGPNISLDADKQKDFMLRNHFVDFYILGEGEIPSLRLLEEFDRCFYSVDALKNKNIDSCVCVDSNGEINDSEYDNSNRENLLGDLNSIPSPWLNGYLDDFFDGKLAPIIETVRGCPFKCTYCVQGTEHYRNVRRFNIERVCEEIEYIAEIINRKSPDMGFLCVADSNFGMYKQDVRISEVIGRVRDRYGWPQFVDATTGKNKKDSILKSVSNLGGSLVMYNSVQSLNPVVLNNVKRKNINSDVMRQIQVDAADLGVKTLTETILGLPGETYQSHKNGLFQLIDMGIKQFTNYQCMLLKGAEMETESVRDSFQMDTAYRILPRNYGIYADQMVFEVEEIIKSSSSLPYSDYLRARKLHLVIKVYYNGYRFRPLVEYLSIFGITINNWLNELADNIGVYGGVVDELFNDYIAESESELFSSVEECVEFYRNNFGRLEDGEVGGNLIMKYYAISIFHSWNSIVEYSFLIAKKMLDGVREYKDDGFLVDIEKYMLNILSFGDTFEELMGKSEIPFMYDIQKWMDEGCKKNVHDYQFMSEKIASFELADESKSKLAMASKVYGYNFIGLPKLVTRIHYSDNMKQCKMKY